MFGFEDEAKTKPKATDSSAIERKMVQYVQVADKPEESHIAITHVPSNPEQYAIIEKWFASGFTFYVAVLNKTHYLPGYVKAGLDRVYLEISASSKDSCGPVPLLYNPAAPGPILVDPTSIGIFPAEEVPKKGNLSGSIKETGTGDGSEATTAPTSTEGTSPAGKRALQDS